MASNVRKNCLHVLELSEEHFKAEVLKNLETIYAITVRFLTKRYIGEYKSNTDWFYRQTVKTDDGIANVEILDISREWTDNEKVENRDQIEWAEAFVIIYSICDRNSFDLSQRYLKSITEIRGPVYVPIILLANKSDLEVGRQVSVDEGMTLALKFGSQFYEISAADSNVGVSQAFQWLLQQTHKISRSSHSSPIYQSNRTTSHRKLSIVTVSRVFSAFGHVFGKNHNNSDDNNNSESNANIIRNKNQTNYVLNTKRKIANVMIPAVRRSAKPVISL